MSQLACPRTPCSTCPYRRDTQPGIWDASEYLKLTEYDDQGSPPLAAFHCHHEAATGVPTLCRGWLACHGLDSVAVRIAVLRGDVTAEVVVAPCRVPVYSSGAEACRAGLAGVARPGPRARKAIGKLVARRAQRAAASP